MPTLVRDVTVWRRALHAGVSTCTCRVVGVAAAVRVAVGVPRGGGRYRWPHPAPGVARARRGQWLLPPGPGVQCVSTSTGSWCGGGIAARPTVHAGRTITVSW